MKVICLYCIKLYNPITKEWVETKDIKLTTNNHRHVLCGKCAEEAGVKYRYE